MWIQEQRRRPKTGRRQREWSRRFQPARIKSSQNGAKAAGVEPSVSGS